MECLLMRLTYCWHKKLFVVSNKKTCDFVLHINFFSNFAPYIIPFDRFGIKET